MQFHRRDDHIAAHWIQVLRGFLKRMWVRATLFSLAAVLIALLSALLGRPTSARRPRRRSLA